MRRLDWTINAVTANENPSDSCFIVGISADEYGDDGHFIFQSGLNDPSEQDRRLGLDTYCVLNEEARVSYGCIKKVTLSPTKIQFEFSAEAAARFELPDQEIEIDIAPEVDISPLRNGLQRVLTYGNPNKIPEMNL
ncbi:Imm10 family immunity protein [Streptomyces griseoruber]|uniref:Imm10 family immunity protein n=1 Tax=Streptomyces griseoruber TaxID=1943 RepID=UPI00099FD95F|nr:Imm10 family immunity protein [Streptomyces griseoruber]